VKKSTLMLPSTWVAPCNGKAIALMRGPRRPRPRHSRDRQNRPAKSPCGRRASPGPRNGSVQQGNLEHFLPSAFACPGQNRTPHCRVEQGTAAPDHGPVHRIGAEPVSGFANDHPAAVERREVGRPGHLPQEIKQLFARRAPPGRFRSALR
jgi:hypothetical protein